MNAASVTFQRTICLFTDWILLCRRNCKPQWKDLEQSEAEIPANRNPTKMMKPRKTWETNQSNLDTKLQMQPIVIDHQEGSFKLNNSNDKVFYLKEIDIQKCGIIKILA